MSWQDDRAERLEVGLKKLYTSGKGCYNESIKQLVKRFPESG